MDIFSQNIPNLRWRKYGSRKSPIEVIEGTVRLEAWDGFQTFRREDGRKIEDGTVKLDFGGTAPGIERDWEPEIRAYRFLMDNQHAIRDSILRALAEGWEEFKETYYLDPSDDPDVPDITPANRDAFDLRPFIGPQSISFHEETKDGMSYLEWFLNCTWDPEHGLSAITHQSRVIDLDRGETDIWKIFTDNGTYEQQMLDYEDRAKHSRPKKPNPWWKFW
jgi:hypothetical protein